MTLVPRAKLSAPAAIPSQFVRRQICERVCAARAARLVLIRAPAGTGKTTVMAQCRSLLEAQGVRSAWLTLDVSDNDPARFVQGLSAAVAALHGGERGTSDLETGQAALALMERLADSDCFVICLDDFEAIQNPDVIAIVRELLHNLPRHGQLMLASRTVPELGLVRLRARGQLLELSAGELRFSIDETQAFFERDGTTGLGDEEVRALHRKTEGWAVALRLVSLALERSDARRAFIERFSGSSQIVTDYLLDEVLAGQAPEIRDFLLRTSVLRSFDEAMCAAVLGIADAGAMLRRVAEAGLFLIPVEDQLGAYRYHSLFAEFLRAQLARECPAIIPALHLAASRWYETQERPVPAIDHAIEGGHFERTLQLLGDHAQRLLEGGRMRLLARWFDVLPASLVNGHALLSMAKVWAICFTRGPWEAMRVLDQSASAHDEAAIAPHVLALRPLLLGMMDRYDEAYETGRQNLRALPTGHRFADSVLVNTMAYTFLVVGQYRESRRLLETARRSRGGWESEFNRMYAETVEGLIELEEAQLRKATARFRFALHAGPPATFSPTGGNAYPGVAYALSLYEAGQLTQAEQLLSVYVPLARDAGLRDQIILGHVTLARIAFQHGRLDHAWELLAMLEHEGRARRLPRIAASARLERSRLFLLQGNADAARSELELAGQDAVWQRVARLRLPAHDIEDLALGRMRWEASCGDAAAAGREIEPALAAAASGRRKRRALKLQLLNAIALHRRGEPAAALTLAGRLLRTLSAEGFVRMVIDEGPAAARIVQGLRAQPSFLRGVQGDPIFDEYFQRLLHEFGAPPAGETASVILPVEALTPKEARLLRLLAEGLSNVELAGKLSVSESTVRTHLRNINMKLNAKSRTQAVAIGRRTGLI
ncbi:MAG: LuxR C-terminal-related transcriptional regulator [Burkholderiaceae bacterium]